jgi:hypothetical protein
MRCLQSLAAEAVRPSAEYVAAKKVGHRWVRPAALGVLVFTSNVLEM